MPHYYFDLRQDGEASRDDEGMELRDFQAVQEVAARSLAEMAFDAVCRYSKNTFSHDMAIEVRDAAGPVLEVRLTLAVSQPKR